MISQDMPTTWGGEGRGGEGPNFLGSTSEDWSARSNRCDRDWCLRGQILVGMSPDVLNMVGFVVVWGWGVVWFDLGEGQKTPEKNPANPGPE